MNIRFQDRYLDKILSSQLMNAGDKVVLLALLNNCGLQFFVEHDLIFAVRISFSRLASICGIQKKSGCNSVKHLCDLGIIRKLPDTFDKYVRRSIRDGNIYLIASRMLESIDDSKKDLSSSEMEYWESIDESLLLEKWQKEFDFYHTFIDCSFKALVFQGGVTVANTVAQKFIMQLKFLSDNTVSSFLKRSDYAMISSSQKKTDNIEKLKSKIDILVIGYIPADSNDLNKLLEIFEERHRNMLPTYLFLSHKEYYQWKQKMSDNYKKRFYKVISE